MLIHYNIKSLVIVQLCYDLDIQELSVRTMTFIVIYFAPKPFAPNLIPSSKC